LGMYPAWAGPGEAHPQTYSTTAGGAASFAHVGQVPGIRLGGAIDADHKGYVLCAGIPRSALSRLPALDTSLRTLVDFEATFGGHNKFWWANSNNSASTETYDE